MTCVLRLSIMKDMDNIIRATITTKTPDETAKLFQAVLAADRGYTSTLLAEGTARTVVASDGQAVRFVKG